MGITKTLEYSVNQLRLSNQFKALGHPARLSIVEHLLSVDSCICDDIVGILPLSQPTISRHLQELKMAGIIKGRVTGNSVCYCLDTAAVEGLEFFLSTVKNQIGQQNLCCKE